MIDLSVAGLDGTMELVAGHVLDALLPVPQMMGDDVPIPATTVPVPRKTKAQRPSSSKPTEDASVASHLTG